MSGPTKEQRVAPPTGQRVETPTGPRVATASGARAGDVRQGTLSRWIAMLRPSLGTGTLAIIDQAAMSGARFLTTVLVGRLCGASELGIYTLGFSLVIIVACAQEGLLATPYAIYSSRLQGEAGRAYAGSLLVHHGLLVLLAVSMLAVTGGLIAIDRGPAQLGGIIWVLVAIVPFTLLQEIVRRFAFAHLRMKMALALDASVAAIQIGGLLLLAATSTLTIRTACLAVGLGCAIPAITWLWRGRGAFVLRTHQIGADLRRNLAFGKWVFAAQMAGVLRGYVMFWVLALVHDTIATGAFAAATSIVLASNPITMGISNLLTPKAARAFSAGGAQAVERVVIRMTVLLAVAIGLFCLLLFLVGDQVMQLLYGAEFAGYRHLLIVLGLGMLARTITLGFDSGLRAMDQPDVNLKAGMLNLAVTFALASLLVGRWSAAGAAYALLVGNIAGLAFRLRIFARMVAR